MKQLYWQFFSGYKLWTRFIRGEVSKVGDLRSLFCQTKLEGQVVPTPRNKTSVKSDYLTPHFYKNYWKKTYFLLSINSDFLTKNQ